MLNLDPAKTRVSAPFFYEPEFEAVVQPIDTLRGNRHVSTPHFALLCSKFVTVACTSRRSPCVIGAQECAVPFHHVWPASGKQGPEQFRVVADRQCMCKLQTRQRQRGHLVQGARRVVCCCCSEQIVRNALLLQEDARDSISPGAKAAEGKRGRNS